MPATTPEQNDGPGVPSSSLPAIEQLPANEQVDAILADQVRRWELGTPLPTRHYFDRYPALREDVAAGAAVLYQEYLLRGGDHSPELLDGYLRRLWEVDEVVGPTVQPSNEQVPQRLGGYEVLAELGRGGMGVVYKALEVRLNRVVALKLIRDPDLVAPATIERFRVEAQAVARLRHPNIVAVYEVGEEAGQHYLAMEYVEGGTLAGLVRESPLPAMEAARYAEVIARAVQHAHENEVVHRDLKPANVLLGADGTPKVADFGLARHVASDHSLTATGEVIGTPSYMPPEQARAEHDKVGPASDVYSLGATLYELVTGRPPFSAATSAETLLQVLTEEPVAPRALNAGIPRDLETICLKCLQKDRAARYATADDLADDLARFQRGEPVRARPVGRLTRGWRWCRRNKLVAGLAVGLLAALVGGLGVVTWQLWRVEQHRIAAEKARDRAQASLAKAQDAVDFIGQRIGEVRLAHVPQVQEVQREVLEYALRFHEGLLEEHGDEPAARWEAVRAWLRVANIRGELGRADASDAAYSRAIQMVEEMPDDYPSSVERQRMLIRCYSGRLTMLRQAGRGGGIGAYGPILDRLIESFQREYRLEADDQYTVATYLHNKAGWKWLPPGEAAALCQRAVTLLRALTKEHPENTRYRQELANACNTLATHLKRLGRPNEARDAYEEARATYQLLAASSPGDPSLQLGLATVTRNLVPFFRTQKKYPEAEEVAHQAEAIFVRLTRDYPSVPRYHSQLAELYYSCALLRMDLKQSAEALVFFEKAARCQQRALEPDPMNFDFRLRLCSYYYYIADHHLKKGDHEAASRAAKQMYAADSGRPMDVFAATGLLARCGELAGRDTRIPADKRAELADKYDAEVLQFLRQQSPKTWVEMREVRSFAEPAPLYRFEEFRKGMREGAKAAAGK
jgi:eukaryotic-like serine/threonine-protein kinase